MSEDIARLGLELESKQFVQSGQMASRSLDDIMRKAGMTTGAVGKLETALDKANRMFRQFIAMAGVTFGTQALLRYADTWKMLESRLRIVTNTQEDLVRIQKELFKTAQETRSSYEATVDLFARVARSSKELQLSQNQLLTVTKAVNHAVILGGQSAQSAEAGLIQLGQAFASGTLRGDELRSVLEQMPRLAEAIATGMGTTVGQLRKLASEGKLTSAAVVRAIMSQSESLKSEFSSMEMTTSQAFQVLRNSILKTVGEMDKVAGVSAKVSGLLKGMADNFPTVLAVGMMVSSVWVARVMAPMITSTVAQVKATTDLIGAGRAAAVSEMAMAAAAKRAAEAKVAENLALQQQLLLTRELIGAQQVYMAQQMGVAARATTSAVPAASLAVLGARQAGAQLDRQTSAGLNSQIARAEADRLAREQAGVTRALAQAQREQAIASAAATRANIAFGRAAAGVSLSTRAAAAGTRLFTGVIGFFGGPVGAAIVAAIGLVATVMAVVGHNAKVAAQETEKFKASFKGMSLKEMDEVINTYKTQLTVAQDKLAGHGLTAGKVRDLHAEVVRLKKALEELNDVRKGMVPDKPLDDKDPLKESEIKKARQQIEELRKSAKDLNFELGDPTPMDEYRKKLVEMGEEFARNAKVAGMAEKAVKAYYVELQKLIHGQQAKINRDAAKEMEKELALQQRLTEALAGGASALAEVTRAHELAEYAEQLRAKGVDTRLIPSLVELRKESLRLKDVQDQYNASQEEGRHRAQEQAEALLQQKIAANDARRELTENAKEPLLNMLRDLQQQFAGFFEGVLNNGVDTWGKLAGSLKGMIIKAIGDLAAMKLGQQFLRLTNPATGMASLMGMSTSVFSPEMLAKAAPKPGTMGMMAGYGGVALGAAGVGYGLGYSSGSRGGAFALGAGGGALTGAMIGSVVPVVGTAVGAVVGAVVGAAAGLFGWGRKTKEARERLEAERKEFQKVQQAFLDAAGPDKSPLSQTLYQLGQQFMELHKRALELKLSTAALAAAYLEQQEKAKQAFLRGIDEQLNTSRGQGSFNDVDHILKTLTENVRDLGIAGGDLSKAYQLQHFQLTELFKQLTSSELEAIINKYGGDVSELAKHFKGLAVATEQVAKAQEALQRAYDAFNDARERYLAALDRDAAAVEAAFVKEAARIDAQIVKLDEKAAAEQLLTEIQVEGIRVRVHAEQEAYRAQILAAKDQLKVDEELTKAAERAAEATRRLAESLRATADQLTLAGLSPEDQLTSLKSQIDLAYQQGLAGDQKAAARFPGLASQYLESVRGFYASGPGYASAFSGTQTQALALASAYEGMATADEQLLKAAQDTAVASAALITTLEAQATENLVKAQEQIDAIVATKDAVLTELQKQRDALSAQRLAAEAKMAEQIAAINKLRDEAHNLGKEQIGVTQNLRDKMLEAFKTLQTTQEAARVALEELAKKQKEVPPPPPPPPVTPPPTTDGEGPPPSTEDIDRGQGTSSPHGSWGNMMGALINVTAAGAEASTEELRQLRQAVETLIQETRLTRETVE